MGEVDGAREAIVDGVLLGASDSTTMVGCENGAVSGIGASAVGLKVGLVVGPGDGRSEIAREGSYDGSANGSYDGSCD